MSHDFQSHSKVWFDPRLATIIRDTFSYMAKNYQMTGVIDHAAWIIQEEELENMLSNFAVSDRVAHGVSFSPKAYNTFVRLIDYAGFAAPKQADRVLLELIHEAFLDSESDNDQIYTVMAVTPDRLTALISAFGKMIDDPGAIDNSMYDLAEWDDFENLTRRLKDLQVPSERLVPVTLTFREWGTYASYLNHVYDLDEEELSATEATAISDLLAELYPLQTLFAASEN